MTRAACCCLAWLIWLTSPACSGVEADLLTLRRSTDLGSVDQSESRDFSMPSLCLPEPLAIMGCESLVVLKDRATRQCALKGRTLLGFAIVESCDLMGVSAAMKVDISCCSPAPLCTPREQGSASSCKDAMTWIKSATWDCASRDEAVESPKLVEPCSADQYQGVRYLCCTRSP